jgi:hypothetical protein
VTSVQTATYDASKVGFNLGGWLGFRVADFPALGVDVRISKATPRFTTSGGSEIDVSAGGLRVGGGVLFALLKPPGGERQRRDERRAPSHGTL